MNSSIITVPIYDLMRSPLQPRMDETTGIEELQDSIASIGLINRPKVIPHPEFPKKYIIQTGHRRIRACKNLGMSTIEVELLDKEDKRLPLADNMLRVDLHIIEIADSIVEAIEENIFEDEIDIASITGKSIEDIKKMTNFGNKFPEYLKLYIIKNSKYIYANSLDFLAKLADLIELKPGKKIIMELVHSIENFENQNGANMKRFLEMVDEYIKEIKAERKKEKEMESDKVAEEIEEIEEIEDIFDFASDDEKEFEDNACLDDEELLEQNIDEYENKINELGLFVTHDDDWRNISIKINIDELSTTSESQLLSVLEKIKKKIS